MWVEQTKTGYRLVERYKDPLTDKYRKVSVKLDKNTKQAINKARPLLMSKIEDKLDSTILYENMTLAELIDEFKKIKYNTIAKNTQTGYNNSCKKMLLHFDKDIRIDKITTRSLNLFFYELGRQYRLNTLKLIKINLQTIFDYAVSIKALKENPFKTVLISSEVPEKENIKFLSKQQIKEVLELVYSKKHSFYGQVTEFLIYTGLRISELQALEWSDYNEKNKTISINKNLKTKNSKRTITLTENLITILDSLSRTEDKIFPKFNNVTYGRWLARLNYNVHLYPHLFRHTHISMLASLGINIKAIMKRVGHADSKITLEIYTHVTEEMNEQLIDKLNNYL